jgi:hypothetical protein
MGEMREAHRLKPTSPKTWNLEPKTEPAQLSPKSRI